MFEDILSRGRIMDLRLKDKLALVSASTAGIGFAIADALLHEGAKVIVNGRSQQSVDAALKELANSKHGTAVGFAGDLSKADAAQELARQYPDVQILVNNLGIYEPKAFEEISDDDWLNIFEVNVLSGIRLARLFL